MGLPTPPLLVLLGHPGRRRRIRVALHSGVLQRCIGPAISASSWLDLAELAEEHPGSPAVVDPGFGGTGDPFSVGSAYQFRGAWSSAPLICYANLDDAQWRQLDQMDIPFTAWLRPGLNDRFGTIDSAILQSIDVRRVQRLLERIERNAHPDVCAIISCALARAIGPCTVREFAADLGIAERTLQHHCYTLRIPSPKTLLSLAKAFTVERLAEWSRQPVGAVALALGFSDRSNYRRMVRQTLGARPSAIRQWSGSDWAMDTIVAALKRADT